jgi:hypothetical protein
MEATELRLGNLVNYEFDKDCGGLSVIEIFSSDFKNLENPLIANRFLPIPLTKEWLMKFGAKQKPPCFSFDVEFKRMLLSQINASNDYNDNENEFTVTIYQSKQSIEICRIKHVHELQNLYHVLTGKQLPTPTK